MADKDCNGETFGQASFMRSTFLATLVTGLCMASLITMSVRATESIASDDDASVDAKVTPLEMKWLRAGWPVLTYAEEQHLPIDIVVQPQAAEGDVPLSMHVDNGRCQLVLSMRGNPAAEAVLEGVPADLQALAIEAMTAHEVAHCWRYMNGTWHVLPAGFTESGKELDNGKLAALQRAMRDTRREEGFADLVGLAWTMRAHPEHYAAVHAWFERVRTEQPAAGGHHDTRTWLQLAKQPKEFSTAGTPFEQAQLLWIKGLQAP
jgi:hypothetical protein